MKELFTALLTSALFLAGSEAKELYQDSFDNDGLATNAGTGGGAANRTIQGHSWTDDGAATFINSGTSYTRRAILYSENAFQSDTGFRLSFTYNTGSIGDTAAHNFSFGLVRSDTSLSTYSGNNPFKNETSVYSLGVNLTADGDATAQGLNFTDTATRTTLDQSGTRAQFKANQTAEVTLEIGIGGYWCYRIDGVYEASGVLLEGFDLDANYHVVVFGQDDNGGGKAIESITLESSPELGEIAADLRGTWSAGGESGIEQLKEFKTMDFVGVGFNSGASQSALHTVPHKLLESLSEGDVDDNGDRTNLVVPLWGDLSLDTPEDDAQMQEILEIRAAGFQVQAYSNCKNFSEPNADAYTVVVERWKEWCDTDPVAQAFIHSQPFHTGVWNRTTEQYEVAYNEDGSETYPNRRYCFCYAEFVLKDYSLRYGQFIDRWIFDSADDIPRVGDNATSGLVEEQRLYQAFANAVHAGNSDIPIAFNNARSTVNYNSFPFAHAIRFEDFTFGHAYGGNTDHASKDNGAFGRNYNHVLRMVETDGYVHDGGAWTWDDKIVGNFHSKLATTSWSSGPYQAWEEADFLQWNIEALQAGGSMTWGGSTMVSGGETVLRPWAYDLIKALDDYLAQYQDPGAPNWAKVHTILPEATIGEAYYHVLTEGVDFWDPEGDAIDAVWFLNNPPSWLSISEDPNQPGQWVMSGLPDEDSPTQHQFTIRARDVNIDARSRDIELQVNASTSTIVNPENGTPVWATDPFILPTAYRYNPFSIVLKRGIDFADFDGDTLTLTKLSGPSWLELEEVAPDIWQLSGTPGSTDLGINTLQLALNDGSQSVSTLVQIDVIDTQFFDLTSHALNGNAYWAYEETEDETAEYVYYNKRVNFDYCALLYSTESFQSDGGFTLRVNYTTGSIGNAISHNFSFGFISTDTDLASYTGLNPFKVDTSVYSLGVNLTSNGDTTARGLNFTNGSSRTTLDVSGSNVQFPTDISTEVTIDIRPNGVWSYSIDGIEEASGVITEGFDLSKNYRVAFYGQDDDGGGKSIQSMSIDLHDLSIPGLVAEWNFDSGNASTIIDSSGNSLDATGENASLVTGVNGSAMQFNGSDSSVTLPAQAFSSIDTEITLAMWLYGNPTQPRADTVFGAEDASGYRVLNLHLPWSTSELIWDAGNNGTSNYDRINKLAIPSEYKERWNHWVFTKNSTTGEMAIYLNGALWHSGTNHNRSMAGITTARLGSGADGTSSYDGLIDEVQLYNVALNAAEVTGLYESYEGYEAWTSRYPSMEEVEPSEDADKDGITSLLEFTLNGSPLVDDKNILPTLDASGEHFIFTFTRRAESANDTSQVFQYSSNLQDWYDLDITGEQAAEVSITSGVEGAEDVTVTVSKDRAVDGRLFGRLSVVR
ncbi:LamG-like jellyroll fold domain-containing protein [Rubritalea sp.]|uniref:LamG-like jellyroll fold domain-containing protein n=1 Tax=Rubritalea sp. TaxID=2109375 RepID=UPI003EF4D25E